MDIIDVAGIIPQLGGSPRQRVFGLNRIARSPGPLPAEIIERLLEMLEDPHPAVLRGMGGVLHRHRASFGAAAVQSLLLRIPPDSERFRQVCMRLDSIGCLDEGAVFACLEDWLQRGGYLVLEGYSTHFPACVEALVRCVERRLPHWEAILQDLCGYEKIQSEHLLRLRPAIGSLTSPNAAFVVLRQMVCNRGIADAFSLKILLDVRPDLRTFVFCLVPLNGRGLPPELQTRMLKYAPPLLAQLSDWLQRIQLARFLLEVEPSGFHLRPYLPLLVQDICRSWGHPVLQRYGETVLNWFKQYEPEVYQMIERHGVN